MDISDELTDLRSEAESMMTDTCVITRAVVPTEPPTLDGDGLATEATPTTVYTGKCSIRMPGTVSTGKERLSAGDTASLLSAIFAIPWDAPKMLVADDIQFTASLDNPNLVGQRFSVTGLLPGSQITKQRVAVESVVG